MMGMDSKPVGRNDAAARHSAQRFIVKTPSRVLSELMRVRSGQPIVQ